MRLKTPILALFISVVWLYGSVVQAAATLKPFVPGSYQQLLAETANQPLMMVVWSITCSSCLKDMALLSKLHKSTPKLKIVMVATDGAEADSKIQDILQKNGLTTVDNWNYADENTAKLQYEIDPGWYGEQPRTYFFDRAHQREGISGVLTEADYLQRFEKILK